jgi:CubicO group peptidase (beta-lactamase class C family)
MTAQHATAVRCFGIAATLLFCRPAVAFEWKVAAPKEAGFYAERLNELQRNLASRRTKALLVIRDDHIVLEWYAADHSRTKPHYSASMAKALVGGVSLAVVMDDGLIALDDPAAKFVQQWRDEPQKSRITVRQLGSHTSGLADAEQDDLPHEQLTGWQGDFWKRLDPPRDPFTIARDLTPLVFDPGARRQYSNPGIAMMSYAITVALRDAPIKDVRTLLREQVMRPIGVPDREWSCGYGKTFELDGLPLVASWGGGAFTARAAARVGRLMLRHGDWDGRQIISESAVEATTSSAGLPGPGGMGWWTNAERRCKSLPRDAFWAAGAGGQVTLVVTSLKLIAVRNGDRLDDGDNDVAMERYFFNPLIAATTATEKPLKTTSRLERSPIIKEVSWAPTETIVRLAPGSDNWPNTWADDDSLYTAYGDGRGFQPFVPTKLSLGLAKIVGVPPDIRGVNLRAPSVEATGDDVAGYKASGMLMAGHTLYMLVRNAGNSQLVWSADHGVNWTFANWKFTESFGAPSFINFGRNYAGARDEYVYVVSHDADSAYEVADRCVLARAPRDRLLDREAWQYFAGIDNGGPRWTVNVKDRQPILRNDGKCYRLSASYNAAIKRYLLVHPVPTNESNDRGGRPDTRFSGGLVIYDAPVPWGPWSIVYESDAWDVGPGETCSFPTKWMSRGGRTLHLLFSGNDSFSVRQATLTIAESGPR